MSEAPAPPETPPPGASHYVVYLASTGRILSVCQARSPDLAAAHHLDPGQATVEFDPAAGAPSDARDYVAGGAVTPKAAGAAVLDRATVPADGTTVATVSALPAPCEARVGLVRGTSEAQNDYIATIDDGVLAMVFNNPGTYQIAIVAADILEQRFEVVAT